MIAVLGQAALPTARTIRWWPLGAVATPVLGLVLVARHQDRPATGILLVAATALASLAVAALRDDAAALLEPVPISPMRRRLLRLALAGVPTLLAWWALVAVAATAASPAPARCCVGRLRRRRGRVGSGAVAGAGRDRRPRRVVHAGPRRRPGRHARRRPRLVAYGAVGRAGPRRGGVRPGQAAMSSAVASVRMAPRRRTSYVVVRALAASELRRTLRTRCCHSAWGRRSGTCGPPPRSRSRGRAPPTASSR